VPYLQVVMDYRQLTTENEEIFPEAPSFKFEEKITLDKLKFSYNDKKKIINGLNLTIKKGEMVGLIGSSGAGKTTIADLLLRLFYPDSGSILIDGKDINQINIKSWRKNVGYVSQDIFMLNDTIKNNIKFYDDSVTKNDIIKATKMANIYSFIESLPRKLETVVGERGIKLSAGQRQRIALARVLAKDPHILILDEATSSLDNKSEALIQKSIENLKGKITVLAIAHRLSTLLNSDKIFVLEKGRIQEEGSPQQLLKNADSHFYKMYNIRKVS